MFDGTHGGEHLIGDADRPPTPAAKVLGELRQRRLRAGQVSFGKGRDFDRDAGGQRLLQQVGAVEQNLAGRRRARRPRQFPETPDDRVLATGDPLHRLLLFSIPFLLP